MSGTGRDGGALLRERLARGRAPATSTSPAGPSIPARAGLSAPLTGTQEGLWFEAQTDPADVRHHRPTVIRWRGPLDPQVLRSALADLVLRHPALTTTYRLVGPRPRQRPTDWTAWAGDPTATVDLRTVDGRPGPARLEAAVAEAATRVFDLDHAGPLPATLVSGPGDDHHLVLALSHLAIDGPSADILVADLAAAYGARAEPGTLALAPGPVSTFADWAAWREPQVTADLRQDQLAWWSLMLANRPAEPARVPPSPRAPAGPERSRPGLEPGWRRAEDGTEGAWAVVPDAVTAGLRSLARVESATLHAATLGAFQAWWWQQAGVDDLVVAVPVSDRDHPDLDGVVGCFVRVLPMRLRAGPDDRGRDLVGRAAAVTHAVLDHRAVSLADITAAVAARGRLGTTTDLSDAHFQYRRVAAGPIRAGDATLELVPVVAAGRAPSVLVLDDGQQLRVAATASDGDVVGGQALAEALVEQLAELVRSPDRRLRPQDPRPNDLSGPPAATTMAAAEPGARPDQLTGLTLVDRFARAEATHGQRPALRDASGMVTYAELGRRARARAADLAAAGVAPGDPVVLRLDRSVEWVVAALAVVLAGGVYVPVDPGSPEERTAAMLADLGPAVAVTPAGVERAEPAAVAETIDPDEWVAGWSGRGPDAPVYVVFTSGSTGRPKGVVVTHANVVALVEDPGYLPLTEHDVVVFSSNPTFDGTTIEVWGALCAGACLVVFDRDTLLDPAQLEAGLRDWGVTVIGTTSALFHAVARYRPGAFATLRVVLFGGESAEPRWVRAVFDAGPPQRLVHDYGPTETTCVVAYHDVVDPPAPGAVIPIGRPLVGARMHVVDQRGRPVPAGVPGELWIGGSGVALGYLGHPELTAERFVPDRLTPGVQPDARLYRSGDLVVRAPDDTISFLGRIDTQVKIRGYRIELGEIEAALVSHPQVDLAAVQVWPTAAGEQALVAYVVAHDPADPPAPAGLEAHLRPRLAPYMLPSRIVAVEHLALTPTGKVDRRALPEPTDLGARPQPVTTPGAAIDELDDDQDDELDDGHATPRDPLPVMLGLWRNALETPAVGPDDHFFDIGGHSLRALVLLAAVADQFRVEVRVADLVEADTPRTLTRLVLDREPVTNPDGVIELSSGSALLDPVWFIPAGVAIDFVRDYRGLAQHLDLRRPARTLDPPGMRPATVARSSVPALVRWYRAQIDELQPTGPLRLVGHSLAGLVTLELARSAQASGRQVAAVVLIDPRLSPRQPTPRHRARLTAGAGLRRLRGEWATSAVADRLHPGRSRLATAAGRDRDLRVSATSALLRYRARPYLGPVTLAVATGTAAQPPGRRGGPALVEAWARVLPRMSVVEVPGTHAGPHSMFAPEHVAATAAAIRAVLG